MVAAVLKHGFECFKIYEIIKIKIGFIHKPCQTQEN